MDIVATAAATTDWITAGATAVGAPVAAVGLIVAAIQLRGQRRITEAQFLLALDEAFRTHDKTHRKLRPPSGVEQPASENEHDAVGRWWGPKAKGPRTDEEWADVEAYMGLFERINVMINGGLIDVDTFNALYGYRVANILSNPNVVDQSL